MKKLLKYDILNSYRFVTIVMMIAILAFIIQLFLFQTTGKDIQLNAVLSLPALAGLTAWLIGRFNDEIRNSDGIMIYSTPNSKTKIIISRFITNLLWVTLMVLIFAMFNVFANYIPFVGVVHNADKSSYYSALQIVIIRLFSITWNITYVSCLIVLGMLATVISNMWFNGKSFGFILSAATYVIIFIVFHIILMLLISKFPIHYVLSEQYNYLKWGIDIGSEGSVYTFFGGTGGSVFLATYNRAFLGIMALIINVFITGVSLIATMILMEKKVEV
jgi:hypothetical protein